MPQMPKLKAKRVYTVPNPEAGEALEAQRGFGDQSDEVQMMNLMMVGGSGYEEMEMTPDSSAKSHQNHHSEHPSSHH